MPKLTSLSTWLIEQPEQVVAMQMGRAKTTSDLISRVAGWVEILARHQGNRWAVYHTDAFEFLAILLALWQLERVACIPGDNCTGTAARLMDHVDGFIGDISEGLDFEDTSVNVDTVQWKKLDPETIALEIYTSGSTGEPKAIPKTINQLDKELETLECQWPMHGQQDCMVLSTVSHQHFYGMIFRLLWPFSAGLPFARLSCEYSEDIFNHAKQYACFSLISSPSHLARMNTTVKWDELKGHCQSVFSASAPLGKKDSVFVEQLLSAPVREVYGSSETGAIAWRHQKGSKDDFLWNALPKISLSVDADNILSVSSPYIAEQAPLSLFDRVLFSPSGGFELIGRVDAIAKVEGKRVSLTAIEKLLLEHDWVKEAKALVLNRKRVETAIVMCLTNVGEAELMLLGRKSFIALLRRSLASDFEAIVLPRRWRFVDVMPCDAQGKSPLAMLQGLFDIAPEIKWPQILNVTTEGATVTVQCHIPANLLYFDGHFTDNPILPGVAQVYWAEKLGCQLLSINGRFKSMNRIKFLQIIGANKNVTIILEYNEAKKMLAFKYQSEKCLHSSGRIYFE